MATATENIKYGPRAVRFIKDALAEHRKFIVMLKLDACVKESLLKDCDSIKDVLDNHQEKG